MHNIKKTYASNDVLFKVGDSWNKNVSIIQSTLLIDEQNNYDQCIVAIWMLYL